MGVVWFFFLCVKKVFLCNTFCHVFCTNSSTVQHVSKQAARSVDGARYVSVVAVTRLLQEEREGPRERMNQWRSSLHRLTHRSLSEGEETTPETDGDEVATSVAPGPRGLLSVLRHSWWHQWRTKDQNAVCHGTPAQVSNLVSKWTPKKWRVTVD